MKKSNNSRNIYILMIGLAFAAIGLVGLKMYLKSLPAPVEQVLPSPLINTEEQELTPEEAAQILPLPEEASATATTSATPKPRVEQTPVNELTSEQDKSIGDSLTESPSPQP